MYTSEADFYKPVIYGVCRDGRMCRTCFTALRLEVVAVAGLLWIYFVCGLGAAGFFLVFFSFSFLRTHTA